jgi:hypothetical protein
MLVKAATGLLLVFHRPDDVPLTAAVIGLALVAIVWLSTALLQAPRHTMFGSGFDHVVWSELVLSDWVRTVAWSARSARPLDGRPHYRLRPPARANGLRVAAGFRKWYI